MSKSSISRRKSLWKTRLGVKVTSMHNTWIEKKHKVIIKIFYTQTHQLCTYNFILGNPFSVFVHETMKTCLMHILFSLYALLVTTNAVLKTMSSQDSYHNYNRSRDSTIVRVPKSHDDMMICIMYLVTRVSHYSCVP